MIDVATIEEKDGMIQEPPQKNTLDIILKDREEVELKEISPEPELAKVDKITTKDMIGFAGKILQKNWLTYKKVLIGNTIVIPNKVAEKTINENEVDDEPRQISEIDKIKKELEKTKKSLADTQKWGHMNSRKLKAAIKSVQGLAEKGVLMDNETKTLLQSLELNNFEVDAEIMDSSVHPITKYVNAMSENFNVLKEIYDEDEFFDKKIESFILFLRDSDPDEMQKVLEVLEKIKDSPLKIAKHAYKVGEENFNEIYKDFFEAGSLKKFFTSKNNEIKKLNKKIDKLKKKLLQYEA